jgi:mono/diheme cytochrome c family protein
MMHHIPRITAAIMLIIPGIFMASCHRDKNDPGYDYLPEMDLSRAYETYSENPVFKDGKTLQPPAEGTIPRDKIPYPYSKNDDDLSEAGKTIFNPLEYTSQNLERGKLVYNRFCSNCHGMEGDGLGNLFTAGVYPYPPGNLTREVTRNRPDGEIYHIITVGYGIMGSFGSQISPEDRWKIIMYVRDELQDY